MNSLRKGSLVTINFDPSAGHEIRKRRPAIVISTSDYTALTGLVLVCPITHAKHNHLTDSGFLIKIGTDRVKGYINTLQIDTFDYRRRHLKVIGEAPAKVLEQVLLIVNDIINAREKD